MAKLKFEIDKDGNEKYEFDDKETEVIGFDPDNPGVTLGIITKERRIYVSEKNPKCVTIFINGRAYQV